MANLPEPILYSCHACKENCTEWLEEDEKPRHIGWYFYCIDCFREIKFGFEDWQDIWRY